MACTTCDKVILPVSPETTLSYHTTEQRILGVDGVYYPIKSALIPIGRRPRGGWNIIVELNGQSVTVVGNSARVVVAQLRRLLLINELTISELDVWFNANVMWLGRAIEKYQKVQLSDLLLLAQ